MNKVLHFFGWLPAIGYGLLAAFAGYAYAVVGHWPRYGKPDPGTLGLPRVVDVPLTLGILFSILCALDFPLVYGLARFVWRNTKPIPKHRTALLVYALGAGLWLCEFFVFKRRLLDWLLD